VNPPKNYAAPDDSFSVDVNVADVINLYGWQVNMSFDPDVLEVTDITEGDFLIDQPEGTTGFSRIENEDGWALFSWSTVGNHLGVDGSGTLATVEFMTLTAGESVLNITHPNTYLLELVPPPPPPGEPPQRKIPHIPANADFSSLTIPPVAEFTYSPEMPHRNETVTFDASASYDDEEIVSYKWDFGDGTTGTGNITTHEYTTSGAKSVTLNVTDNVGLWTVETDQIWVRFNHDIAILSVAVSQDEVGAGGTVSITVEVTNIGEEAESFSVTAYADIHTLVLRDEITIGTQTADLNPDATTTLTFPWTTTDVELDTYTISAKADVTGDGSQGDNTLIDGSVTVNPAGPAFDMTLIIIVVVVIVVVVVGVFLYMRRGS
jgi:PKD repeat protein